MTRLIMNFAIKPEISVLIPTHNGAPWITETLSRLPAAAGDVPFKTIIADNSSADKTISISQKMSGVQVIRNETNLGFSHAVNQAAATAKGDILIVINQDLYLEPGSLKTVYEFLSSNKAVVGGRLSFPDGSYQASCGPFPTLAGTLCRLLLPKNIRKNTLFPPRSDEPRAVDWVTGAFIGFHRETFDRIGGFDEDYFMYYEDVDFCLRARRAGFPSYFLPSAKAVHVDPHSARKHVPDWLRREIRLSQTRFFRKHRPAWEHGAISAINRAYFAANGWQWR
jgi:GT2 family glycosyltransferase